jgi:cytochrome c-type biogenesis protein CcmH
MRWLVLWLFIAGPAWAVLPDEVLPDTGLEARARALSQGLRCVMCQNESIDDSNAPVSRDLRLLVRERLMEGDTDAQVLDFVVERYGEFVLMEPQVTGINVLLYLAGPLMLLGGAAIAIATLRRRGEVVGLSAEEDARLQEILKD